MQANLSYDTAKLSLENKAAGTGFSDLSGSNEIAIASSGNSEVKSGTLYILTFKVLDTAELNNIVIKKNERGNGYSSLLLKELINIAAQKKCNYLNLEVASNNDVAINLYKKFGFKQVGIRPNYYNGADALLLTLEI